MSEEISVLMIHILMQHLTRRSMLMTFTNKVDLNQILILNPTNSIKLAKTSQNLLVLVQMYWSEIKAYFE